MHDRHSSTMNATMTTGHAFLDFELDVHVEIGHGIACQFFDMTVECVLPPGALMFCTAVAFAFALQVGLAGYISTQMVTTVWG